MKRIIFYILLCIVIFPILLLGKSTEFDKSNIKCGTFNSDKDFLINKITMPIDTIIGRPKLQVSVKSQSGLFAIHFDTTGYHKVPIVDNNQNGIPDYVDSVIFYVDYIYNIYIFEIGYQQIPADDSLGVDDSYDIYLMNIGDGEPAYYGITVKDFEIKPRKKFPRYATHIFLDNDYSPYDSTIVLGEKYQTFSYNSFDLLKITIAHELHHSIQLNYGDDESITNTHIINEMTSTWMEYRIFPNVKDYLNYISSFCKNSSRYPLGTGDPSNGYKWALFGQYLYSKYQDQIILRTWQLIGDGVNSYKALDSALVENSSNLKQSIWEFFEWLYYTGYRAEKKKLFPDADLLPPLTPYQSISFEPMSITQPVSLLCYEIKLFQIILPPQENTSLDTLDLIFSNASLISAILQNQEKEYFDFLITNEFKTNFLEIGNTNYFYNLSPKKENILEKLFYELSQPITYAYPNPFRLNQHSNLLLPVKSNDKLNSIADITFYTNDMIPVLHFKEKVSQIDHTNEQIYVNRGILINKSYINEFEQGVYIFSIKTEKNYFIGKIAITR